MTDLGPIVFEQAGAMTKIWQRGYTFGLQEGRREALEPIVAAYRRALNDPQTKIPSCLMVILEAASRG